MAVPQIWLSKVEVDMKFVSKSSIKYETNRLVVFFLMKIMQLSCHLSAKLVTFSNLEKLGLSHKKKLNKF